MQVVEANLGAQYEKNDIWILLYDTLFYDIRKVIKELSKHVPYYYSLFMLEIKCSALVFVI